MGIFDNMFGNNTPAPAATTTPVGNAAPAPSPQNPANPDPFSPNHTTDPKPTATPVAPLAEFGDLFKVDDKAATTEDAAFTWNYDKDTLAATVGNMSFVNPTEMSEVATQLGVQNPEALATFMNNFGRTLYMQSLLVNSKMSEQSVNIAQERFAKQVPQHIRSNLVNNEVSAVDANFANPALQPIVQMISGQIAQKNPGFTAEQVAEHTKKYMSEVGQVFAPQPKTTPNNPANTPADFTNFFGSR